MPEYRTPSFLKPRTYEEIPASIDALFNAYQRSRQQSFGEAGQMFGLQSQLAGQGVSTAGYDPENPSAFFEPIIQEARTKRERETTSAGLGQLEKLSNIQKNLGEAGKSNIELEGKLRQQLQGLSKPFFEVRDAYSRVQASAKNPSAAGDLALIFNYMKILDPDSTVREGEFATAQNSGSIPQRIIAQYNRALSGERLPDTLRTDFVSRAGDLYQAQLGNQTRQESEYKSLSERLGVKPENVVLNLGRDEISPTGNQDQSIQTRTLKDGRQVNVRRLPNGTYKQVP